MGKVVYHRLNTVVNKRILDLNQEDWYILTKYLDKRQLRRMVNLLPYTHLSKSSMLAIRIFCYWISLGIIVMGIRMMMPNTIQNAMFKSDTPMAALIFGGVMFMLIGIFCFVATIIWSVNDKNPKVRLKRWQDSVKIQLKYHNWNRKWNYREPIIGELPPVDTSNPRVRDLVGLSI